MQRTRGGAAVRAALLVLLVGLAAPAPARAATAAGRKLCVVDLVVEVGPAASSFVLAGRLLGPEPVPIRHTSVAGVAGSASLLFDGPCPLMAGLPEAVKAARLRAVAPSGIRIARMSGLLSDLATVEVLGLKGDIEAAEPLSLRDGSSPFNLTATAGTLRLVPRGANGAPPAAAPLAAGAFAGAGCTLRGNIWGGVRMECPQIAMSRTVAIEETGQELEIEVRGVLTASGKLSAARTVSADDYA
ncbi:MAG: hypothetical protein J3K34DRAFT_415595 [Monoraphidium minutum]|nr:MAG: hypothetical protein J3K34DRAFT_415595 [Monoraphidium minutum]